MGFALRHTDETVDVVVGTPIYRQGAFVIDKFLANQKEIQQNYPSSELILATCEHDFSEELKSYLSFWRLKGCVLDYKTVKPTYARSKVWNVACGREAIRQYTLLRTKARYLLFLDADMTVEASVVRIMEREMENYDVVFNGCPLRDYGIGLAGDGCVMLTREVLEKLTFRCYEFKNGEVIFEDNVLEMDLFRLGSRIKKGFFLSLTHYINASEAKGITAQQVGTFRRISNYPVVRYGLIRLSIMVRCNIPWRLKIFLNKLLHSVRSNHILSKYD